jgi:hypothetical protein
MRFDRLALSIAIAAAFFGTAALSLLASGCGGSENGSGRQTFIREIIDQGKKSEPAELVFSVNGDLTAEELEWSDWGEPTATASGTFLVRDAARGGSGPVEGSLEVTNIHVCQGENYYTRGTATLPPEASFQPMELRFSTPCEKVEPIPPPSGGASIDPTPENQSGAPSGEFEPEDIERAENADRLVELYCTGGPASEAQQVGCLSHVTIEVVCEQDTAAKTAAVAAYIGETGDEAICD